MFLLSRLGTAARLVAATARSRNSTIVPRRWSSDEKWLYRTMDAPSPKSHVFFSEAIVGLAWYWILFHLWYDIGHVIGEHDYPDPSKWTDAELGIPPLEED